MRSVLVALAAVALLTSCSPAPGRVEMKDGHRFVPSTTTVGVGDTVTFVNADAEAHTVTAYEDSLGGAPYFDSGRHGDEDAARSDVAASLLVEGESYQVTFETAGTYRYFCIPHEQDGMTGTIVVE